MDSQALLEDARRLLAGGDALGAVSKADEALVAGASRGGVLRVKAEGLLALGRGEQAEAALRELSELRPDDPWAYTQLAAAHLAARRTAKARALLERALALEPGEAEAVALMGQVQRAEAHGQAAGGGPMDRTARRLLIVLVVAAILFVLGGAALAWWLTSRAEGGPSVAQAPPPAAGQPPYPQATAPGLARPEVARTMPAPSGQPPVTQAQPPGPAQPQVTQAQPAPPPQPEVTQAAPTPPAQPPVTAAQPKPQPVLAPKPGDLRVVWYRAQLVGRQTYGNQEQQKYEIWGEVANDGGQPISGAVVGWVSIQGAPVAYGLQALYNVQAHSTASFDMLAPTQGLPTGSPEGDTCQVVAGPMSKNIQSEIDAGDLAAALQGMGLSGAGGLLGGQ